MYCSTYTVLKKHIIILANFVLYSPFKYQLVSLYNAQIITDWILAVISLCWFLFLRGEGVLLFFFFTSLLHLLPTLLSSYPSSLLFFLHFTIFNYQKYKKLFSEKLSSQLFDRLVSCLPHAPGNHYHLFPIYSYKEFLCKCKPITL